MAEKYKGSFVSKNSLDAKRSGRRSYLEQELEKAKDEFEAKKRQKELREQRGETTWMLPSLSKRLKQDEEKLEKSKHKKKKKKHEKKSKKHKKEKKHKKKHDERNFSAESNSSGESGDDEWIEKTEGGEIKEKQAPLRPVEVTHLENKELYQTQSKRDDWMMAGSFLDTVMNSSESLADKRARKEEEKKAFVKPSIDELGQHPNELNPFWKGGGTGVPTNLPEGSSESSQDYRVGDAGSSWVRKAFERAKEQAEEQGRSLEEIVAERWGSMEKLNALLKNEGKRQRRTEDRESRRGWRSKDVGGDHRKDRWKKTEQTSTADFEDSSNGRDDVSLKKNAADDLIKRRPIYSCSAAPAESQSPSDVTKSRAQPSSASYQNVSTSVVERNSPIMQSSSASDSDDSSDSEDDVSKESMHTEPLSEKEINEISAKILRAELMGDQELAESLKAKLEAGRKVSSAKASSSKQESKVKTTEKEEEIILTRTDKHGNVYPLKVSGEESQPRKKRKKMKKIETHDAKGSRLRYFQEDDSTDLKSMVEEERLTTAEDHQTAVMSRLTKKLGNTMGDYYTLDDMFETSSATKQSRGEKDEIAKKRAVAEHQKMMTQQANCRFCFDNPDVAKHLIISIASHVYLALPITSSLTEGHCLIIPTQHTLASTYLDEDVMQEVMMFRTSLTKMFKEKDQDVIFLETVKNLKRQQHMLIECIPVPIEVGDVAPIYFKKAIQESESEWAQNKKLVDVSKNKGIKSAIPKGLPYFSVEFGMDGGFAHVIEDETIFPHYFGKEIVGGILDLEPMKWRKPPKESFQQHKRKVLNFSETWEPFDWTRDL